MVKQQKLNDIKTNAGQQINILKQKIQLSKFFMNYLFVCNTQKENEDFANAGLGSFFDKMLFRLDIQYEDNQVVANQRRDIKQELGVICIKQVGKTTLMGTPQDAKCVEKLPASNPPNFTNNFKVQQADCKERSMKNYNSIGKQKISQATMFKTQGDQRLKQGEYNYAVVAYSQGIKLVEKSSLGECKQLLTTLRLRISQTYLKLNQNGQTIDECSKILDEQGYNDKALYRRGSAYLNCRDFERAMRDFNEILERDPGNGHAKRQLMQAKAGLKGLQLKQKKTFDKRSPKGGPCNGMKPNGPKIETNNVAKVKKTSIKHRIERSSSKNPKLQNKYANQE